MNVLSKKDIVFLQSDASYCNKNEIANLTVFDTSENKFYNSNVFKIKNSTEAEFQALVFSIKIAKKNEYKNVIFVYDCNSLNIESLSEFCKTKCSFYNFQFLWLPRTFLLQTDEIARTNLKQLLKKYDFNLTDGELIKIYKTFNTRKILLSVFNYLDDTFVNEKKAIDMYLENKYSLLKLQKIRIQNQDIFRFIYHILDSDEKQKFYAFFSTIMPTIQNSLTFLKQPKKIFLAEILREILSQLKIKKGCIKRE
ncbi:MAG: hypothetical protein PHD79_08930 [Aliarcobacter sp.]|nr:hypothetical protein [Aliarcobacter sp.]